jgi:hypothetical protein
VHVTLYQVHTPNWSLSEHEKALGEASLLRPPRTTSSATTQDEIDEDMRLLNEAMAGVSAPPASTAEAALSRPAEVRETPAARAEGAQQPLVSSCVTHYWGQDGTPPAPLQYWRVTPELQRQPRGKL